MLGCFAVFTNPCIVDRLYFVNSKRLSRESELYGLRVNVSYTKLLDTKGNALILALLNF